MSLSFTQSEGVESETPSFGFGDKAELVGDVATDLALIWIEVFHAFLPSLQIVLSFLSDSLPNPLSGCMVSARDAAGSQSSQSDHRETEAANGDFQVLNNIFRRRLLH
ncbi:hypothetical protein JG687_00011989 [Phytophthora cactorum]|uniref:Uncharacterized protein n=1 Tax=Phytophthora cactorum TaxID=29920 RepID=A0A329S0N1_9STRA|nr:hypothetical protein Pcac1_g26954 [Phytophthora cactorum]KAG2814262.1 hypothetical protein PC112_g14383 [Phytophthora cactorum]KAG2817822.1 hypothetical protein PC111_g12554 [Phytophthora cactorum]KAG2852946.1 hypothetical protein PC113_g14582 [Phytophthora cactorum]KAG2894879.1 hypothetical protein PC114_g15702 [Phytophthora cactorum]